MAAPSNDNFANATVITGLTGSIAGTNISASGETGETANNSGSVWYSWVAPSTGSFVFSTCQTKKTLSTLGTISDPLTTVLQVFTGTSLSGLTEVSYWPSSSFKSRYSNYDLGSQVTFDVTSGTQYYIRVDGMKISGSLVSGSLVSGSTARGNFPLSWWPVITCCNSCNLTASSPYVKTLTMPYYVSQSSYGVLPPGEYEWRYCNGAFRTANVACGTNDWTVIATSDPNGENFGINYNCGGAYVRQPMPTTLAATCSGSIIGYSSQTAAETAFQGNLKPVTIHHGGGEIYVTNSDPWFADNNGGSPDPTFALLCKTPGSWFVLNSACASWVTSGSVATATFTFQNMSLAPVTTSCIATFTGGGANSTLTKTLTAASGATATVTYNYSASQLANNVALTITDPFRPKTFNAYLSPLIIQPSVNVNSNSCITGSILGLYSCSGSNVYAYSLTLQNIGNATPSKLYVNAWCDNGVQLQSGSATWIYNSYNTPPYYFNWSGPQPTVNTMSFGYGAIKADVGASLAGCNSGVVGAAYDCSSLRAYLRIIDPGSPKTCNLYVHTWDTQQDYGTITASVSIP